MLRSDLCDFSYAYIVVKGTITVAEGSNSITKNRPLAFKTNTLFIGCILKINNALIDNAEDLAVVMAMCNLIGYSEKYRQQVVCEIITEMN